MAVPGGDSAELPGLAEELLTMAEEEEESVHRFFLEATADPALAQAVFDHVGWHPGLDPVEWWESTERAPTAVWSVRWDAPPPVVASLINTVRSHTARLRQIVDRYGWPGRASVGEPAADAAWFLVMHADGDPDLQRRCVQLLGTAVAVGDADPRHLANLTDRMMANDSGRQTYGTLAMRVDERIEFLVPLDEPELLQERRHALGLPRIQDDLRDVQGQLPYRHLRRTPAFEWPPLERPHRRAGAAGSHLR